MRGVFCHSWHHSLQPGRIWSVQLCPQNCRPTPQYVPEERSKDDNIESLGAPTRREVGKSKKRAKALTPQEKMTIIDAVRDGEPLASLNQCHVMLIYQCTDSGLLVEQPVETMEYFIIAPAVLMIARFFTLTKAAIYHGARPDLAALAMWDMVAMLQS